jgi:peptidoglycan/xylan/chitin deacetylase (PgdA/CDA1 family)
VSGASIPILVYHEVSPAPPAAVRRYAVTVGEFARQLAWLADRGYQSIDMEALVRARTSGGTLPRRPVLITFDDGVRGCADHAVPLLQAHGFTAVFYLVAGLMGDRSRWMARDPGVELPLMTWDQARALANAGFQCGVHSMTHPRLTGLEPGERRVELAEARRLVEDELGRPALHFAYPYGAYDAGVRAAAVEAGYATACSTRAGLSRADDDLLALHRITVHGHDSMLDFACRLRTGAGVREAIGRAVKTAARRLRGGRGRP